MAGAPGAMLRVRAAAPRGRLAEIEVLRALAILMVMVQHLPGNLLFWPTRLDTDFLAGSGFWTGVDLFFAISGFVIARSLLPQLAMVADWPGFLRVAVSFWIARAWRLLPSAWLWLALPLILCLTFNRSGVYGTFINNWSVFIAGMLYVQNFHEALSLFHFGSGTAFVQWSLSLEEQFYFLLPFAAFFFRRHLTIPLALIAAAGFFVPNTVLMHMVRLWPVAFGVLLAIWSRHDSYQLCAPAGLASYRTARAGMLVLLLTCLVSLGVDWIRIVSFYQGAIALIAAILVWLASYDRGFLWQEGMSRRVLGVIAARSYVLYLVHIPVYFAAHEIWFRLYGTEIPGHSQAWVLVLLTLAAVFAVAELNHRFLETPLREHGKRLARHYRDRLTPQPAVMA